MMETLFCLLAAATARGAGRLMARACSASCASARQGMASRACQALSWKACPPGPAARQSAALPGRYSPVRAPPAPAPRCRLAAPDRRARPRPGQFALHAAPWPTNPSRHRPGARPRPASRTSQGGELAREQARQSASTQARCCCTALRHQQTARLQPAAPAQGRPAALICPQRAARERGKERSDYREVFKLIQQQPRKCLPRTVRSIVVPLSRPNRLMREFPVRVLVVTRSGISPEASAGLMAANLLAF